MTSEAVERGVKKQNSEAHRRLLFWMTIPLVTRYLTERFIGVEY